MIWQLVKRDPAWRSALISTAVSAVVYGALPPGAIWTFGGLIGMFWLQCQPQLRATDFQAALPIRACDLFLARILAFLALLWLPVASGVTLLVVARNLVGDALILVEIGAGFSVLVLVAQSSRVRETTGSRWVGGVSVAIAWGAAWPILHFVPPAIVLVVCALLCAALFWNIWRQLPPAFEVLSAKLALQVPSQRATAAPAFVWWPVLRSLFQPGTLVFLPLIVLGAVAGQWPSATMFCLFPVAASMAGMPWALGLPVRRGVVLAVILLPWVMTILLGVLLANSFEGRPPIRLKWSASNRISEVRPPLEFWRTGTAPIIESAWGESWQPETVRWRGVAIYNPYSFGPGNSARFFEWQFRRATEAVYGQEMNYADFKRHRPTVRPLLRQARFAILNAAACASCVMLLVNLLFASLHWRVRQLVQRGASALVLLFAGPTTVLLLSDMVDRPASGPITASLVKALLLRISALLPAGLPAVVLAPRFPSHCSVGPRSN